MNNAYKVAIIDDGKVEFFGGSSETRHSEYLFNYIDNHYKNHPVFSRLNENIAPEQLACFLVYLEKKAIVLNETRIDEQGICKNGSMACVILPDEIDGNLLSNLLACNLERFSNVIVEKVTLSPDRILEDNMIFDHDDLDINDRLIEIAKDSANKSKDNERYK